MDFRKRKHQETPIPPKGKDPTATWKPNVRPDKSFHFSFRKKQKKERKKTADSSSEGLKRFRKKRLQKIIREGNIVQREVELENNKLPRRNKREKHADTANVDITRVKTVEKFDRIIPLGNSQDGDPFTFPSQSPEQTKNEASHAKTGEENHRVIPLGGPFSLPLDDKQTKNEISLFEKSKHRTIDLEKGANAKKPEASLDGKNKRESLANDCNHSVSKQSTITSVKDKCHSREPIVLEKNRGTSNSRSERKGISGQDVTESKAKHTLGFPRTQNQDVFRNKLVNMMVESSSKTSEAKERRKTTSQLQPTENRENKRQEEILFIPPNACVGIKEVNELFKTDKSSIQCDSIEESCSLQKIMIMDDRLDRESSGLMGVRKNLDRAMTDEEYGSDYHNYYDDENRDVSNKKSTVGTISRSLLLSKAGHLALSRKPLADVLEKVIDDTVEIEPHMPKTSLMRSETQDTTGVMGLSPVEAFRRRDMSLEKDLQLGNRKLSPLSPKIDKFDSRPSHEHCNILDLSSSSESESDTNVGSSDSSRHKHYSTPKPKQLLDQFNSVEGTAASTIARDAKRRKLRSCVIDIDTRGDFDFRDMEGMNDHDIPKYILGKTNENKKTNIGTNSKHSLIANHPLRHNTSGLDEVIAIALGSQKKKNTKCDNPVKRKSNDMTPKVPGNGRGKAFTDNKDPEPTAFRCRNRSSFGIPRKRKKTMSDFQVRKMTPGTVRHVSLSPEKANSKPPRQHDRARKHEIDHFRGRDIDESDPSDWSDWDIERIPRKKCSDEDSSNTSSAAFVENHSADEEDNANERGEFESSGKSYRQRASSIAYERRKSRTLESSAEDAAIHPNSPRVAPNWRRRSGSTFGTKKAFLFLFLFGMYIVRWAGYDTSNPSVPQNSARILERRERMLHRIRFSQNPNFSLLRASKIDETSTM